jgi:hypothetical protein
MKSIRTRLRAMPAHDKAMCIAYALALITMILLFGWETAHAQGANVHAKPQAQVGGNVYEAVVLQVSIQEVEARLPMRALFGRLLGDQVAKAFMKTDTQEIIARFVLPNGSPRTVVILQPAPFERVYPQELVYVSEMRGVYRVLKRPL